MHSILASQPLEKELKTIFVPQRIENNIEGFDYFARLYNLLKEQGEEVLVDFVNCSAFEGNLCAIMGAIFDKLTDEGVSIKLSSPTATNVCKSLGRNNFFTAWNLPTDFQEREYYIIYHDFAINDTEAFKKYIDAELVHKQKFPEHTEKAGDYLVASIFEIYVNCSMHGNASKVVCCGEYDERSSILHLTIVDCGRTIVENVNSFFQRKGKPELNASSAIEWAFGEGNTTKEDTGGLGLWELRRFMSMNDGSLEVMSGSGLITIKNDQISRHELTGCFPGTVVNLNFNFNDTNRYYLRSEETDVDVNDFL